MGTLAALLVTALATGSLATWQGYRLSLAHDVWEIRQPQSAEVFGVWLSQRPWASDPAVLQTNQDLISLRLRLLRLTDRRRAVLAMSKPDFFAGLGLSAIESANARTTVLAAVKDALTKAPALADLWFLNAKLSIDSGVFDEQVLRAFKLSYLLGPRETELVLGRLVLGRNLWPELDEEARRIISNDYTVLADTFPKQAHTVLEDFRTRGVDLGLPSLRPEQN